MGLLTHNTAMAVIWTSDIKLIGRFIYISGAQTVYEAGQLLSSALLAGHIECFLAFCYNEMH
jgi:hypothetical protein